MHYTAPAELVEMFSLFVSPDLEDEKIDLIRGALVIARSQYPELDIEEYAGRIERMARRVAAAAGDLDRQAPLRLSIRWCSIRQICAAIAKTIMIRGILF